ncbi:MULTISPECIES: hypothetical protein [Actinomyces]|nr:MULTISPECIES: hypothetical protein [Actinomyces]
MRRILPGGGGGGVSEQEEALAGLGRAQRREHGAVDASSHHSSA